MELKAEVLCPHCGTAFVPTVRVADVWRALVEDVARRLDGVDGLEDPTPEEMVEIEAAVQRIRHEIFGERSARPGAPPP